MEPAHDLSTEAVAAALPGRAVRAYPAMLSTEADAMAWGRAGGPDGAVVVSDYQASPRGRGGWEWKVTPGHGLGFSLLFRPALPVAREGWPYLPSCLGLADVIGADAVLHWPDEVHVGPHRAAGLGVHTELNAAGIAFATATVLIDDATPPRTDLLARAIAAIEFRMADDPDTVLHDYRARCVTLGLEVSARLVPMGPAGIRVDGTAVDCRADGSLVILGQDGRRVAVPPQHLGILDVTY